MITAMARFDLCLTAMPVRQFLSSFQWELRWELHTFAPFVRFWAWPLSHRVFLQNMQCQQIQASRIVVFVAGPSWIIFGYFFPSLLVLWIQLSSHIFWNIPLPTRCMHVYTCVHVNVHNQCMHLEFSLKKLHPHCLMWCTWTSQLHDSSPCFLARSKWPSKIRKF